MAAPHTSSTQPRLHGLWILGACFFLSGMGSLALEVVWTRELRLIFGSTTLAASTILVAYMLGLGIGGLLGGRLAGRIRDGVRAYGWIEIAIGLYALVVPWLLRLLPELNRSVLYGMSFWPAALCRFLVALLLLLVPTVLMGATLPILVATLVRRDPRVADRTGLLYGLNTLGAVAGVFLATFVLFARLGLTWTNVLGALLDVLVGVLALSIVARRLARWQPAAAGAGDGAGAATTVPLPLPVWALLATYATVGFTALLYEVAWTRALAVVLGSSIYAFSSMLGAFLSGIALGSLLLRRWIDRSPRPLVLLEIGLAALAVLGLATTLLLPHLPSLLLAWIASVGLRSDRIALAQVGLSMLAMLPPTLVLGALFPLVTRLLASGTRDAGDAVGKVYFANTLGSATGAFCTGFVLVPRLGLRDTLALGAALNLAVTGILLLSSRERRRRIPALLAFAAAATLLVVPIPFDRSALTQGIFRSPEGALDFGLPFLPLAGVNTKKLLFYRDGLNSTVSVERDGSIVALRVNGKIDASNFGDMPTQVLLGELPLLFGPPAKKVLVIGYASGVTTGSVVRHAEVERIDAVEIEPAIIEASHFFDRQSGRPLDDPRVHLVLDDARSYLAATRERYDAIVSEPSNPWMSGVSNLFTREFFAIAHRALAPGGRLLQWVQLYSLEPQAFYSILAALHAEFPYVYGMSHAQGSPDLLLLACDRPLTRDDLPRWEKLPEPVRADLERIGNFSSMDLWSLVRLLPSDVATLAARASVINGDDNMHIELDTPWMLHEETVLPNWTTFDQIAPRAALPLLESAGEPLDHEALGGLALSYTARRGAGAVANGLLKAANKKGRAAHSIAAAVLLARDLDESRQPSLENQLASLDEALRIAPGDADVLLLRAEIALEAERPEQTLEDADAVLATHPGDLRAQAFRVRALTDLGRAEEARGALQPLLGSPMLALDPELQQYEGRLDVATGRYEDGAQALLRYLHDENSNWVEGWTLLAEANQALGRADEAAAAEDNAERTSRNQAILLHRQARAAAWRGDAATSESLLGMVLTLEPDNEIARAELDALKKKAKGS